MGKVEDLIVSELMVIFSGSMLAPINRQEIRPSKTKDVWVSVWPGQPNLNSLHNKTKQNQRQQKTKQKLCLFGSKVHLLIYEKSLVICYELITKLKTKRQSSELATCPRGAS